MIDPNIPVKGALSNNPASLNQQSPLGFRMFIKRAPNVNYYVDKVNIPGLELGSADHATPYLTIPEPGDHIIFDPLMVTFRISEGLANFIEIQKWMKALGGLPSVVDYTALATNPEYTGYGLKSEIIVAIEDAAKNTILTATYQDAWPTKLVGMNFDTTLQTVEYLSATVAFRYLDYTFDTP